MDREAPPVPRDAITYELIISALYTRYQQSLALSSLVLEDDDDDEGSSSDSDMSLFQMSQESSHEYERDFMEIYQLFVKITFKSIKFTLQQVLRPHAQNLLEFCE